MANCLWETKGLISWGGKLQRRAAKLPNVLGFAARLELRCRYSPILACISMASNHACLPSTPFPYLLSYFPEPQGMCAILQLLLASSFREGLCHYPADILPKAL